ncbi:GTPase HflX [Halobacteria archaeon AArc-m2/3/4]|uniref:GTPase HflX n=1 Tax=Natronoglomus mannanivorans TaxID=2979990 RepID=A0ABT2Q9V6_9EURY|nr:GTPase HflX [Halobacteria archaeon AArc-m2/3/4]
MSEQIHIETPTIVVKREPTTPIETDEIRALVSAAGHSVVGERTQVGPEDSGTYLGRGALDDLSTVVDSTGAGQVVVDDELTPGQHHSVETALPDGTRVLDRYRLVLGLFESGANTRRARLQVELATLRYDLPRVIESAEEGLLNRGVEKGSPVYDIRDRIDRLERKLAEMPDPADQFRKRRREEGFDLVTIAGYTNAGKSTLLRRLADELCLEAEIESEAESGFESTSTDETTTTAAVADRLFETLETTTRRATIDGRPVLATDTVGFVSDLPHWLVASFSETLSEAAAADAVILVADATDPCEEFREKLAVALDVLDEQGVDRENVITACNKTDRLTEGELESRLAIAEAFVPSPIPISARAEANLDSLRSAVRARLPTERATLQMPAGDEAMAVVSRAYDRTSVETVDYDGSTVRVVCDGPPSVVERLRARTEELEFEAETDL